MKMNRGALLIVSFAICLHEVYGNPRVARGIIPNCVLKQKDAKLECNLDFVNRSISASIKLNQCDEPMKMTVKIVVESLDINWSKKLETNQNVPIPNLSTTILGVPAVICIQTHFYRTMKDHQAFLKVKLVGKPGSIETKLLPSITLFNNKVPFNTACGGGSVDEGWSDIEISSVTIACILAAILLSIISCYAWKYCRG